MLFSTPEASLATAVTVLLLVLGYGFLRPARGTAWLAFAGYAAALVSLLVAGLGPDADGAPPHLAIRAVGGAALVAGLLLAGAAAPRLPPPRAASREQESAGETPGPRPASRPGRLRAYGRELGLGFVLLGQLLRRPSFPGAVTCAIAALLLVLSASLSARSRGLDGGDKQASRR